VPRRRKYRRKGVCKQSLGITVFSSPPYRSQNGMYSDNIGFVVSSFCGFVCLQTRVCDPNKDGSKSLKRICENQLHKFDDENNRGVRNRENSFSTLLLISNHRSQYHCQIEVKKPGGSWRQYAICRDTSKPTSSFQCVPENRGGATGNRRCFLYVFPMAR
jgi:hypothetical protein